MRPATWRSLPLHSVPAPSQPEEKSAEGISMWTPVFGKAEVRLAHLHQKYMAKVVAGGPFSHTDFAPSVTLTPEKKWSGLEAPAWIIHDPKGGQG